MNGSFGANDSVRLAHAMFARCIGPSANLDAKVALSDHVVDNIATAIQQRNVARDCFEDAQNEAYYAMEDAAYSRYPALSTLSLCPLVHCSSYLLNLLFPGLSGQRPSTAWCIAVSRCCLVAWVVYTIHTV